MFNVKDLYVNATSNCHFTCHTLCQENYAKLKQNGKTSVTTLEQNKAWSLT